MRTKLLIILFLATGIAAMAQDNFPAIPHRHCGTQIALERQMAKEGAGTRAISTNMNYIPHTGQVTIPVILVNFKDVQFTINNPKEAFEQFFNGDTQTNLGNGNQYNRGSVAKYFHDMSGGNFQVSFKVYGPVTVDHDETYYGGTNELSSTDERPEALVSDAINKLQTSEDMITDVTAMSSDGSTIDCVYIVYAGVGQNDGGTGTSVWANTGMPNYNTTIGGKRVRWYSMAGELFPYKMNAEGTPVEDETGITPMITGVGVTCHELSHALGLPDFYPTDSNAYVNNQEMEYWDLMDGGEYAGNGFCPTAYTAFEKSEMGWPVDIQELDEDKALTMSTSTEMGGTAYKIQNPDNDNEYLMLECIQRRGWNNRQYGNGLLVYHVNRPDGGLTSSTRFNNIRNYPGMAVVPADGACLSSYLGDNNYLRSLRGDLFPGSGNMNPDTLNVRELSDAKPKPNFCWYNSSKTRKLATNKALKNIRYDTATGVVSFSYINDVATGIKAVTTGNKADDNRIFSIDGQYLGTDISSLPKGIYIIGGKKIIK